MISCDKNTLLTVQFEGEGEVAPLEIVLNSPAHAGADILMKNTSVRNIKLYTGQCRDYFKYVYN